MWLLGLAAAAMLSVSACAQEIPEESLNGNGSVSAEENQAESADGDSQAVSSSENGGNRVSSASGTSFNLADVPAYSGQPYVAVNGNVPYFTETFEALRGYIDMNFDGLKDDVLSMMAGEMVPVNTGSFSNDMTTFHGEDDVLTLLIHLGYLGYDFSHKSVFIPNNEIRGEFVNAVSVSHWGEVSKALKNSADLLNAIWKKDEEKVAAYMEQAHFETSHLQYNDENALSYTVSLALYAARNFYQVYREFPSGSGFADIVYLPRKGFLDKPALIVELKWNKSAEGAIQQILKKQYFQNLEDYSGNMLLVGINYDLKTRKHECKILEFKK